MSMQGIPTWFGALVAIVTMSASFVHAQGFYYKEILKDGRIYVFNIAEEADRFEKSGEMGRAITRPGAGPNGETVVADSERALEFFFKHGISEPVQQPPPPPPEPPPWRISRLVFGDYYWFSSNHLSTWEDQHGFWIRRAYFTYDHRFTPTITTRLRLEVNRNGQLEGGNLEPYIKDVYVQWTYFPAAGGDTWDPAISDVQLVRGLLGATTHREDPRGSTDCSSSRDFGLTSEGRFLVSAARYVAQFGNESGTGSEADKYKAFRFEGRFDTNPGFALEGFYGNFQRANNQDRRRPGVGRFRTPIGRAGLQYLYQQRQSGTALPDTEINIVSAFGVFDPIRQKLSLFARVDWVNDPLPGADGIDYLPIDPGSKFTYSLEGSSGPCTRPSASARTSRWCAIGTSPSDVTSTPTLCRV